MRFLKALVVIMGVLIVVGVAILAVEIAKRMNDPERAAEKAAEKASATIGAVKGTALGLPQGARIGEVLNIGPRLVVKVSVPGGDDRLYLLDPRSGAVSGLLTTGGPEALESVGKP